MPVVEWRLLAHRMFECPRREREQPIMSQAIPTNATDTTERTNVTAPPQLTTEALHALESQLEWLLCGPLYKQRPDAAFYQALSAVWSTADDLLRMDGPTWLARG